MVAMRTWYLAAAALLLAPVAAQAAEKVDGYAEYRKGEALIVDGQRIVTDGKTRFEGTSKKARSFKSIPLGYEVVVKGARQEDGSILAREVQASRNRDSEVDVELKKGFDQMEALYVKQGRMAQTDENGKVVEDMGKLLTSGPLVDRTRRIATSLAPPSVKPEDFRVYVVENEEWNAMAAPNFSIYVFSGLLQDMDDDEVALVVGHELTHALYEHSRRQYEKSSLVQQGAAVASEVAGGLIKNQTASDLTKMGMGYSAMTLVNVYSRDDEDQADRVGMRYAYEAGYDISKGPKLWQRFAQKYGDTSAVTNFFLGDHSRASTRAKLLAKEIEYNYGGAKSKAATDAK